MRPVKEICLPCWTSTALLIQQTSPQPLLKVPVSLTKVTTCPPQPEEGECFEQIPPEHKLTRLTDLVPCVCLWKTPPAPGVSGRGRVALTARQQIQTLSRAMTRPSLYPRFGVSSVLFLSVCVSSACVSAVGADAHICARCASFLHPDSQRRRTDAEPPTAPPGLGSVEEGESLSPRETAGVSLNPSQMQTLVLPLCTNACVRIKGLAFVLFEG